MASGMVRCAIATVIEKAHGLGKVIMERVTAGETEITLFEDFSTEFMGLLRRTISTCNNLPVVLNKERETLILFSPKVPT